MSFISQGRALEKSDKLDPRLKSAFLEISLQNSFSQKPTEKNDRINFMMSSPNRRYNDINDIVGKRVLNNCDDIQYMMVNKYYFTLTHDKRRERKKNREKKILCFPPPCVLFSEASVCVCLCCMLLCMCV